MSGPKSPKQQMWVQRPATLVVMIKSILAAILLFISSLFSGLGSSGLAGSSEILGLRAATSGVITSVPVDLATANAEQLESIKTSEWKSEVSPKDFSLDFQDQTISLPCNSGNFTLVDGAVKLNMLTEMACAGGDIDLPFEVFLSEPTSIKVDRNASLTPERIYLVNGDQAITLIR